MARSFRGGSRTVRGPRRQVTWVAPADQGYIALASTTKVLLASFSPEGAGMEKPTVVRTRGQLSIRPNVFSGDVDIVGAFGLGIVSAQALAIGITAIPGPFDDADWDGWFVWRSFSYRFELVDGTGDFYPASSDMEIDSKAMRKVADNEAVVIVMQSQIGAMSISAPLRLLFKLA